MAKSKTIKAFIGFTKKDRKEIKVYVYGGHYVQHGGTLISMTFDVEALIDGVHLFDIYDSDCISVKKFIENEEDLITAIES